MKKKLILLLSGMSLLYSMQSVAAAGYFKSAAAFAWSNKFAVVAATIAAQGAQQFLTAWDADKLQLENLRLHEYDFFSCVRISLAERLKIEERVKSLGVKKVVLCRGEIGISPISTIRIGDTAAIFFNEKAENSLSRYATKKEKTETFSILEHEYVHIKNRDSEKSSMLHRSLPTADFLAGVGAYKGLVACLKYISDPKKKLLAQGLAATVGASVYFATQTTNVLLEHAYSRHQERQADKGIFQTGDRELIKAAKGFFETFSNYSLNVPEYLLEHPPFSERIDACDKALDNLDRLQNGESHE